MENKNAFTKKARDRKNKSLPTMLIIQQILETAKNNSKKAHQICSVRTKWVPHQTHLGFYFAEEYKYRLDCQKLNPINSGEILPRLQCIDNIMDSNFSWTEAEIISEIRKELAMSPGKARAVRRAD